ncbi:MAG TPA: metalloregulator ArsR/SmtB family transcription factor [Steroidobacteraceae bacterium]|nr:metalloregulator ArsR/SmtB family transcription factor [Steroidobacteraceae bacterium]
MNRTSSSSRARATTEERLDALFHALSDRTRRALLARLTRRPAIITELARPFAMSLPALSRHIRVLEGAGLVKRTVDGRMHRCTLDALPLRSAEDWLSFYRRFWDEHLDALARYVEKH